MTKKCNTCSLTKDLKEFPPNKSTPDGLNRKCRGCFNAYMRAWYVKNSEVHKSRLSNAAPQRRARKYGLTPADVDAMMSMYDGKCHLCKKNNATDIDHCHVTSVVRGILCNSCNTSLGKLGDTPELIKLALDYVSKDQTPIPV